MYITYTGIVTKAEIAQLNSKGVYQQKIQIKPVGSNIRRTLTLFGHLIFTLKNSELKRVLFFKCTVRIDPNDKYKRPYNNVESISYRDDDLDTRHQLQQAS